MGFSFGEPSRGGAGLDLAALSRLTASMETDDLAALDVHMEEPQQRPPAPTASPSPAPLSARKTSSSAQEGHGNDSKPRMQQHMRQMPRDSPREFFEDGTPRGARSGKGDTNCKMVTPPNAMTWSDVRTLNDSAFLGHPRTEARAGSTPTGFAPAPAGPADLHPAPSLRSPADSLVGGPAAPPPRAPIARPPALDVGALARSSMVSASASPRASYASSMHAGTTASPRAASHYYSVPSPRSAAHPPVGVYSMPSPRAGSSGMVSPPASTVHAGELHAAPQHVIASPSVADRAHARVASPDMHSTRSPSPVQLQQRPASVAPVPFDVPSPRAASSPRASFSGAEHIRPVAASRATPPAAAATPRARSPAPMRRPSSASARSHARPASAPRGRPVALIASPMGTAVANTQALQSLHLRGTTELALPPRSASVGRYRPRVEEEGALAEAGITRTEFGKPEERRLWALGVLRSSSFVENNVGIHPHMRTCSLGLPLKGHKLAQEVRDREIAGMDIVERKLRAREEAAVAAKIASLATTAADASALSDEAMAASARPGQDAQSVAALARTAKNAAGLAMVAAQGVEAVVHQRHLDGLLARRSLKLREVAFEPEPWVDVTGCRPYTVNGSAYRWDYSAPFLYDRAAEKHREYTAIARTHGYDAAFDPL